MASLTTYGDWCALLAEPLVRLDTQTYESLLAGQFEESAAMKVLELIAKSVESLLNAQAGKLNRVLQSGVLAEDDVEWALVRFHRFCQKIVRLYAIAGLPVNLAQDLDREARGYVCGVFQQVQDSFEGLEESSCGVSYQATKLRKCWIVRE